VAEFFEEITDKLQHFIKQQKIFFVGTAAADGRVSISPKGMDSLRIVGLNRVLWLNLTGSGNETAAHVLENRRITMMFCSFEKRPLILRLYGQAEIIHPRDAAWQESIALFPEINGARQILDVHVDLVQTSCGYGVPYFDYVSDRDVLEKWADAKGEKGIEDYWRQNNQQSLDGKPTSIIIEDQ
jgi:predicted pyridoxine 5'-phosphate oxidase superfamily flavin-nucleotide-binding protein